MTELVNEDDFTHYFNATSRLTRENAELRAQVAELKSLDRSCEPCVRLADEVVELRQQVAELRVVIADQGAGLAAAEEELTELRDKNDARQERDELRDHLLLSGNTSNCVIADQGAGLAAAEGELAELRAEVERWRNFAEGSWQRSKRQAQLAGLPTNESDEQAVNEAVNRATAGRKGRSL